MFEEINEDYLDALIEKTGNPYFGLAPIDADGAIRRFVISGIIEVNPFQWPEIKEKIAETNQRFHFNTSKAEKEIFDWICKCYNKTVIHNDRQILNGKELDIYIPDLCLAFEYDGRYWHADPELYKVTDIIDKRIAQEIWDNDKQKTDCCKELGITLIRIKEQDYLRNKNNILYFIMLLLEI